MLKREAKMATVSGVCHNDPNFAVICSFLDRYSEMLALPSISYSELESWIEETKRVNPNLIDLHVRLLRRSGKKSCLNVTHDRWEKALFKFCHSYSNVDAWEIERFTYRHCKITTKLKLLKNLLECQFDTNIKFKDRVNEIPADDMRCLPIGRDKHGLAYWFMLDKSLNLRIYRNDLDDVDSETWQLVCRDRDELAKLIQNLEKGDFPKIEKSDLSDASCKSDTVSDFNEDSRDSFTRSRSCTPIKPSPLTIKSEHTDEEDIDSNSEQKHSSGRLTMTLKVPKLEADSPRKRLKDKFEKEKGLQIKNKKKCKIKEEKEDDKEGSCDNENIVSTKTDEDAEEHEISVNGENDINTNCDENIKEPDITEEESNTSAIKCDKSIDEPKPTEKDDKDLDENSCENIKNDEMSGKKTDIKEDEIKNDEVDGLGNEVSDAEVVQVNKETPVDSSNETNPDLEKKTSDSDEIPTNEKDLTLENAGIDKNNSFRDDQDKTSESHDVSLADAKQLGDAGSNVPDSAETELKETTPLASDKDSVTEGSKDPYLPDEISCTDKELTQLETESNLSVEQEQKQDSDTVNCIEKNIPCKVDQISDLSENLSKVDKIEEAPIVSTKDDNEKHELSENEEICLNEQKLNEQNDELSATKLDSDDKKDDRTEISESKKTDNDSDIEQQEPSSESICPNSLKESDIGSKTLGEDSEERIEKSNKEQEIYVKQSGDILEEKTLKEGDNSHTESIESRDKLSKEEILDSLKEEKCSQDDLSNGKNLPEACTDTTETVSKEDSVSDEKPQPKSEEASPSVNSESVHEATDKEDEHASDKCAIKSNDNDRTDQEHSSGQDSEISEINSSDMKSLEEEKDKELNEATGDAVKDDKHKTDSIKSNDNDRTDQEHSSGRDSEISDRNSSDTKSLEEEKDKEINVETRDAVKDDKHKTDSEISERNSSDTKSLEEEKDKEIDEETGLCLSSFTASPGSGDAEKDDKDKTQATELEEDSCKDTSVKRDNTPYSKDEEVKSVEDVSDRNSSDMKSLEEEKDKEFNEETGDAVKDDKHKIDSTELEGDSCKDTSVKGDNTHCSKDEEVKSVEDVLKDKEIKENLDDENTELKDNEIKENLDDEITEEDDAKCEQISKVRKATKRQTKVAVRKLTKASKSKSVTSKKSGAVEKDKDEEHSDKESSSETSEEDTSSSESSEHLPKTKMKGLLAHSRLSRGKAMKRQAEDSCEEEPVEPASKRSKVRGRVTSKGRNKRRVPVAESSDSSTDSDDVPLSQVSSKTKGKGKPVKKAQKKKAPPAKKKHSKPPAKKASKPVKKKVSSDGEESETTPVKSKRGKSDKIDEENHEEESKPPEDEDFDLSEEDCGRRRSARVRTLRARKKEPSPEYLPSDFDDLNLDFDSGDDDFVVRSKRRKKKLAVVEEEIPKGKNAKRLEAKTSKKTKQVEEEEEESEDETPCCKCLRSEQPEWILLCDKCDAGYHTACLRPPLMIIPDGDWYCPPCEHAMLIEKLQENLTSLDQSLMKSDRLVRRKERLAFVGISLDNIIKEEKAEEVEFQTDTESGSSNSDESKSESESESESSESSAEQEEQRYPRRRRCNERVERRKKKKPRKEDRQSYVKRTCRSRNPISYKFEEFDELIMDAIHEDMSIPKQPKPKRVVPPGISRGKDMSNILGVSDEEEKEKKKSLKKRRPRLTELDDTEEDDDTDDYHVSLESSATDVSRESEGVAESGSDFSDEVRGRRRRGRRGARKATRKSHRKRRGYSKYDDFVVESDYDSEEDDYGRRSTRKSARRHVNYRELNSDESIKAEETDSYHASDFSSDEGKRKKVREKHKSRKDRKKRHKRHKKRKHVVSSDEESEETDSDSRPSSKKKDRKKRYDSEAEEDTSGTSGDSDSDQHRRHKVGKPGKKKGRIESDETESETENERKSQAKGKRTGKVLESETGSESEAGKDKGAGDGDEDGSGTEVSEGDWEEIEIDINSGSDKLKSPKHKGSPTKLRRSSDVNNDMAVQDEGSESEEEEELEPGEIRVKRPGKNIRKRKKSESNSQEELDHVTKSDERSDKETANNSGTPIYECSVSLEPLSDTVLHSDSIYKGEHSMEELQDSASDSSPVKKKRTRRTKAQMEAARKVEEELIQQLIMDGVPPEVARKRICGKKARSRSLEQLPAPGDTSDRAGSVTSVSEVTLPARSEDHVRVESCERQTNVGESDNKKIDTEIVIKKEPSERKDDSPLSARRDYNNAPVGIVKPEVRQGVIVENRQVMDSMRGPLGPGGRPLVGNMVSPLQGMKDMSMGKIPDQGGFSPPNMPPGYQNRGNSEGFRQPNYPGYPPQQGPYGHPQQGFQQGMPHRPYPHSDDQGAMSPGNYPPPAAGQYMSPNMPPGPQGFHPGSFRASLEGPQSPPAGYGGYGPGAPPMGGPNYPQQGPYGQGFHSPTGPYQGQMHGPYPEPPGQQPGPSAQMNYPPNMPSGYPQIPQPRHPHPGGMHYPPSVPPVNPNQPVRPQPYSTPHTGVPQSDPSPVKSAVAGVPARSRRGFMMDNILKPTSSRPKEDENGDEINDIVNYVANDEYFKEH